MNNYDQHMKHWGNHRKDRYKQQCSGYGRFDDGNPTPLNGKETQSLCEQSFNKLLEEAKGMVFPIWIAQSGGWYWFICDEKNMFGQKIDSYEDLKAFGADFVFNENDYS